MLTILIWLMMQGQAQVQGSTDFMGHWCQDLGTSDSIHSWKCWDKNGKSYIEQQAQAAKPTLDDPGIVQDQHVYTCGVNVICDGTTKTTPAPAEHVIEIRTKMDAPRGWKAIGRPGLFACEGKGATPYERTGKGGMDRIQCFGMTRELWIDGQRIGIVKGLE